MDDLALSTSYFAGRRLAPAAMAAAVRGFGLGRVELGYLTRETEVEAWEAAVAAEGLTVGSVHAFCPASVSDPFPGPESFSLAEPDGARRAAAVRATFATLDCAVRFGARAVVMHGGRVDLRRPRLLLGSAPYRSQLSEAFAARGGRPDFDLVEQERAWRAEAAGRWMDALSFSLDAVLPHFEEAGVTLAFENLPGLEAFPDPAELDFLRRRFPSPCLGAWYDVGHGERKARVGDWPQAETLALVGDCTVGAHLHDVSGLEEDHRAPGEGGVDWAALRPLLSRPGLLRVLEPAPDVSGEALRRGIDFLKAFFGAV